MIRTTMILSSLAAGLVLIGLVSESVLAERGWRGHRGGPLGGPRAELMYEALDLTTEQRQAIDAAGGARCLHRRRGNAFPISISSQVKGVNHASTHQKTAGANLHW